MQTYITATNLPTGVHLKSTHRI